MNRWSVGAISLSAVHLEQMVEFYSGIFGIGFTSSDYGGQTVYEGRLGDIDVALYRADDESPCRNPIHYEVFFSDLEEVSREVVRLGGRTNGQPMEDDEVRAVGVFDPDGNFMVFKQRK
jgi:predicted enzyme related to lactoylglutathione lyase